MERLTTEYCGQYVSKALCTIDRFNEADDCDTCLEYCKATEEEDCSKCAISLCFNKLAEYEDLEEQGKLLRLPCAVGDTVYRINKGAKQPIIPLRVLNFKIFNNNLVESFKMECADEWDGGYTYKKTDIGRDVFLTKEEAQQALKEMEE